MPTEKDLTPAATHVRFPYWFANAGTEDWTTTNRVHGIDFRNIWWWNKDLLIYYGDRNNPDSGAFVNCWCSRWTVENYNITVETWLKKDDLKKITDFIIPGNVKEMYNILGLPHMYDTTFKGRNSVKLVPNLYKKKVLEEIPEDATIPSNLPYMRKEVTGYCKTIMTGPIESDSGWILLKMEFATSSSAEL